MHWKATLLYHQTKDILYVMQFPSHKNIIHTFRYVHLADVYFPENTQKYYTRVTSTVTEGETLVQQGFELVSKDQSGCLWRKPKTFEDIVRERERELSVKSEF